jgi:quercetin dioxygenase-like cupin family protein
MPNRRSAVATGAGALPAQYVFHAVGPVYHDGSHGEPEQLASCYRTCLELAEQHGVRTISFPAISTGVYGYPLEEAATSIARLVGEERSDRIILLRQDRQEVAQDPSGWERRILSPVLPGVEFEFMRTTIRAGVDAGSFSPHSPGSREYVAIEKGALLLTIGGQEFHLNSGDSIYYAGDCIHSFANPGKKDCIYYLVMDVSGDLRSAAHVPLSPRKRRASQ